MARIRLGGGMAGLYGRQVSAGKDWGRMAALAPPAAILFFVHRRDCQRLNLCVKNSPPRVNDYQHAAIGSMAGCPAMSVALDVPPGRWKSGRSIVALSSTR
jgi:hypothetical protein